MSFLGRSDRVSNITVNNNLTLDPGGVALTTVSAGAMSGYSGFFNAITGVSSYFTTLTGTSIYATSTLGGNSITAGSSIYTPLIKANSVTGTSAFLTAITGTNLIGGSSITGSSGYFTTITGSNMISAPSILNIPYATNASTGSPSTGQMWNSANGNLYIYNGSAWKGVSLSLTG